MELWVNFIFLYFSILSKVFKMYIYWLHKQKYIYIYVFIKRTRNKEASGTTKWNPKYDQGNVVCDPAHFSQIKSISPILLQFLHSIISDGYRTAYKWMNHNWFNPLSLYNWEIIEAFFPFFILLVVTVLNIFVHKSHPPYQHFYMSCQIIWMSRPLHFSLSERLHNQKLNTPNAFAYPPAFHHYLCILLWSDSWAGVPSSTSQHLKGPPFQYFSSKQHCHHTAHFS